MAQAPLVPGRNVAGRQWIREKEEQMTWFVLKDTLRMEIGTISNRVLKSGDRLTLITKVDLKGASSSWIDSSIAESATLKPIYHASYNTQRDMVLQFGHPVTGYYKDKQKDETQHISDTVSAAYFDSNLYPYLVSLLPLKAGYSHTIAIYDYRPGAGGGAMKAYIKNVRPGTYTTASSGLRKVWIVTVSDDIGGPESSVTYYFDQSDRRLWQQEILAGDRKMLMVAKE